MSREWASFGIDIQNSPALLENELVDVVGQVVLPDVPI